MATTEAITQRDRALSSANQKRIAIAGIRAQLSSGQLTIADVMMDPPRELLATPLIDILRMQRGRVRSGLSLTIIGEEAIDANVNLLLPLGIASARVRGWVAAHGMRSTPIGRWTA